MATEGKEKAYVRGSFENELLGEDSFLLKGAESKRSERRN